ncbi:MULTISPECIES: hypothetical protein [Vibrio harveyi group]|uniref:hypothetical protein n=1 Tax=Vibrio harveyi group TaxID=717610 RepID=UPI00041E333A|nr:hypothetical protein [Vibrio parahaemolyticus]EGR1559715.1 hypothetical protein [Vibrio parahaemolyticus]EGV1833448.1 hypothetical protein [Vibrio parahaemolyticus]EHH1222397.1 hypothetical protein [Vibrio parahaemolyticus]EHW0650965.1 hypothetical protein [Vibrio parahaemolyticus]EIW7480400.1 hypothetical protein [Vibrio parahaemolyticus]
MKEMVILVHTATNTAYASGNKQFFDKSKDELLKVIQDRTKHGSNQNFLNWSSKFESVDDLDYVFIKCPDSGDAKKQSKRLMQANGWAEISLQTLEKEVV